MSEHNSFLNSLMKEDEEKYARFMGYPLDVPCQGVSFDLFDPDPNLFSLEHIAKCLGAIVRYLGGTKQPISVAEHCMMVAQLLREEGYDTNIQLAGLLHDASEAYLGDICKPLKDFLKKECSGFKDLFNTWDTAVYKRFGVNIVGNLEAIVKQADIKACTIELQYDRELSSGKNKVECVNQRFFSHYDAFTASMLWHKQVIALSNALSQERLRANYSW